MKLHFFPAGHRISDATAFAFDEAGKLRDGFGVLLGDVRDVLRSLAARGTSFVGRPLFFLLLACAIAMAGTAGAFIATLPDVSDPAVWIPSQSITVRDRNGREMYNAYQDEDRIWIDGEQIPTHVKQAFIAIEDRRFYERGCVDWRALGRAVKANITDYKSQGASTITQQLVRTAFLSREKRFSRKAKELLLACRLEDSIGKEEILTSYLNWIPFGHGIAGVKQASTHFFGKEPAALTIAEAAVLASLPQRPSYFSPYGPHRYTQLTDEGRTMLATLSGTSLPVTAVTIGLTGTSAILPNGGGTIALGGRAHQVLSDMQSQGFIDETQKIGADKELLSMRFEPNVREMEAPHYVLSTLAELQDDLPEDARGQYTVTTTIDLELQRTAQSLVETHAKRVAKQYKANGIAMVVADLETREILAYIGNASYFGGGSGAQIDMAKVARQPGSSFKPIVYTAAMQHAGWKPTTMIYDTPIERNGIRPRNYAGDFMGPMPMISALNYSRNIPAIRAYDAAGGEEKVLAVASALGVDAPLLYRQAMEEAGTPVAYDWPLAIGAAEVPLLEMVEAYATLADGGVHQSLMGLRSVTGPDGDVALPTRNTTQAVPGEIADAVTSMLSEARARPAGFWRDITNVAEIQEAVKTGTSNVCLERRPSGCVRMLPRDVWAIGYTPRYIVGVWMGNVDGAPLTSNADGLNAAVPLWRDMLQAAHSRPAVKDAPKVFAGARAPYFEQHPYMNPSYQPDPKDPPTWIGDKPKNKKKELSALP